ncbi:MAG: hypothetical protein ACK56F_28315, partial [bacterium]
MPSATAPCHQLTRYLSSAPQPLVIGNKAPCYQIHGFQPSPTQLEAINYTAPCHQLHRYLPLASQLLVIGCKDAWDQLHGFQPLPTQLPVISYT